jgi:hypothetical protein
VNVTSRILGEEDQPILRISREDQMRSMWQHPAIDILTWSPKPQKPTQGFTGDSTADTKVLHDYLVQMHEHLRNIKLDPLPNFRAYPKLKADKKDLVPLAKLYKTLSEPDMRQKASEMIDSFTSELQLNSLLYGDGSIKNVADSITEADYQNLLSSLKDTIEMVHFAKNHPRELIDHLAQFRTFKYDLSNAIKNTDKLCVKIIRAIRSLK